VDGFQELPMQRAYLTNSPAQIGKLIRRFRKEQSLTQKELARKTRCSAKFIGDVENGKTTAEIGKVLRLILRLNGNLYLQWNDPDSE
jgi:HTH-type transcriptional regulator/antitoxin HipB